MLGQEKQFIGILLMFMLTLFIGGGHSESCTHYERVTANSKSIQSPRYPSKFPPQTQCMWRLHTEVGHRIKVEFSNFQLAAADPTGSCRVQWINIMDGQKNADEPGSVYTFCGTDVPRTIVSSGNVVRINLHSNNDARSHTYRGFSARLVRTQDTPYMPGDPPANAPAGPQRPSYVTLDSVLNRLSLNNQRPARPRPPRPTTESERIEEMNRRRNLGLPPEPSRPSSPAPSRRPNRIMANQTPRYNRRQSVEVTTRAPYIPRKRRPQMAKEIKIVVIMVSVLAGLFIIVLVLKKCGFFKRICNRTKEDEKKDGDSKIKMKNLGSDPTKSKDSAQKEEKQKKKKATEDVTSPLPQPKGQTTVNAVSSKLEASKSRSPMTDSNDYSQYYSDRRSSNFNNHAKSKRLPGQGHTRHETATAPPLPPRSVSVRGDYGQMYSHEYKSRTASRRATVYTIDQRR
nr:uncharacterized protein LOC100179258 [Ciona intestinalis]|eukprot:XP_002121292.1 uncharacterized protein LOC100179258 [Ciona intestinalis]